MNSLNKLTVIQKSNNLKESIGIENKISDLQKIKSHLIWIQKEQMEQLDVLKGSGKFIIYRVVCSKSII